MWSNSDLHKYGRSNDGYLGWSGKKNEKEIPSFKENINFFWNYQMKHMYIRYFMWNFSGKQNDIQGHGNKLDGNWITGINLIDNHLLGLGPQKKIPKHLKENPGHNKYFLLPFLLGLFGMIFHAKYDILPSRHQPRPRPTTILGPGPPPFLAQAHFLGGMGLALYGNT